MTELLDHVTLKVGQGEDLAEREFFMSFGLLRDLSRAFPNPQDPAEVMRDMNQFETALWLLLVPRSPTGKLMVEEFDLNEHAMAAVDSIALVKWAMEHLIRFFLLRLNELPTLGEQSVTQIEALLSAFPGLKDSVSKSLSAGPLIDQEVASAASTKPSRTKT